MRNSRTERVTTMRPGGAEKDPTIDNHDSQEFRSKPHHKEQTFRRSNHRYYDSPETPAHLDSPDTPFEGFVKPDEETFTRGAKPTIQSEREKFTRFWTGRRRT